MLAHLKYEHHRSYQAIACRSRIARVPDAPPRFGIEERMLALVKYSFAPEVLPHLPKACTYSTDFRHCSRNLYHLFVELFALTLPFLFPNFLQLLAAAVHAETRPML